MHDKAAEMQVMPASAHDIISCWHSKLAQEYVLGMGMMQQMPYSCMQMLLGSSSSCKMHCMMYTRRTQTAANNVATRSWTVTRTTWNECTSSMGLHTEPSGSKQGSLRQIRHCLRRRQGR